MYNVSMTMDGKSSCGFVTDNLAGTMFKLQRWALYLGAQISNVTITKHYDH